MASASFVEIISHFAGYLQIFHDIARDRVQYDESLAPRPPGDYTTLRPNYDYRIVPEDMETAAGPVPELMPDDPIHFVRGRPLKLLHGPQDDDFDFFPRSAPNVPLPKPPGGGGGGGGVEHHVTVKYQDGGPETQLTVHQYNFMHDDDVNLSADALAAVAASDRAPQQRCDDHYRGIGGRCERRRFPSTGRCRRPMAALRIS